VLGGIEVCENAIGVHCSLKRVEKFPIDRLIWQREESEPFQAAQSSVARVETRLSISQISVVVVVPPNNATFATRLTCIVLSFPPRCPVSSLECRGSHAPLKYLLLQAHNTSNK